MSLAIQSLPVPDGSQNFTSAQSAWDPWSGNSAESNTDQAAPRGALAELSEAYRRMGFKAGYNQAVRDQLESFVLTAESLLRDRDDLKGNGARPLLYAFIARLEQQLSHFAEAHLHGDDPAAGYVDGGLGI